MTCSESSAVRLFRERPPHLDRSFAPSIAMPGARLRYVDDPPTSTATADGRDTMMQNLRFEQDGPIATITLDRPPVNAIDAPMMRALIDVLRRVDGAGDVA